MKKLYEWRAVFGDELILPPPAGDSFDQVELDDQYESEDDALAAAKEYESNGGFCDLVLLTVYQLSGQPDA